MQKRGVLFPSTRAQITIFMVLGVVILFIFLFLIIMTSRVALNPLEESREEIFSKAFRKEAMRIFVEDCLRDELRSALRLIGKQGGKIWDDQVGGSEQFAPGVSGIFDASSGDRVAYALTRKEYLVEPPERGNPYPCNELAGEAPVFCKYIYPTSDVRFGVPQPWERTIETELENYLRINAQSCIENFLKEKVPNAKLSPDKYELDVDLQDDGIAVKAFYPLRFGLEGKEYFTLSTFDFLYPSSLRRFLRAVYFNPLQWDWQYVDFAYKDETLHLPSFSVKTNSGEISRTTFKTDYDRLGIVLQSERLAPNGDTLFTATSPFPNVVDTPGEYVFTFARQNRPPALDYVGSNSCAVGDQQYDYLVVKGADDGLGEINIELKAKDPDEEEDGADTDVEEDLKYLFSGDITAFSDYLEKEDRTPATVVTPEGTEAKFLIMTKEQVQGSAPGVGGLSNGPHTITAKVKDSWGQEDSQEVRILVDNALDPSLAEMRIEYLFGEAPSFSSDTSKKIISTEDPFIIKITLPEDTSASVVTKKIKFRGTGTNNFEIPFSETGESCVFFPTGENSCEFDTDLIPLLSSSDSNYQKIKNNINSEGTFTADFSLTYCGEDSDAIARDSQSIDVVVKACVPHFNEDNPFPYIPETDFHEYVLNVDGEKQYDGSIVKKNEGLNPFLATHASCDNGNIRPECKGPPNCADLPTGWVDTAGYLLVEHKSTTNDMGNACNNAEPELKNGSMTCGNSQKYIGCLPSSSNTRSPGISPQCIGKPAWNYHDSTFCMGTMGCSAPCDLPNNVYIDQELKEGGNFISIANYVKSHNGALPSGFDLKCQSSCPPGTWYKDTNSAGANDGIFSEACP